MDQKKQSVQEQKQSVQEQKQTQSQEKEIVVYQDEFEIATLWNHNLDKDGHLYEMILRECTTKGYEQTYDYQTRDLFGDSTWKSLFVTSEVPRHSGDDPNIFTPRGKSFRLQVPLSERVLLSDYLTLLQAYLLQLHVKSLQNSGENKLNINNNNYDDQMDGLSLRLSLIHQLCDIMEKWRRTLDLSSLYICKRKEFFPINTFSREWNDPPYREQRLPKLHLLEPTLASIIGPDRVGRSTFINSLNFRYMPPEILLLNDSSSQTTSDAKDRKKEGKEEQRKTEKAAVYSLACLVIYILTGRRPWSGLNFPMVHQHLLSLNHDHQKTKDEKENPKEKEEEQGKLVFQSFRLPNGRTTLESSVGKDLTTKLLKCLSYRVQDRPTLNKMNSSLRSWTLNYNYNRLVSTPLLLQELRLCNSTPTTQKVIQTLEKWTHESEIPNEGVDHRYPLFYFTGDPQNHHIVQLIKHGYLDERNELDITLDHSPSQLKCSESLYPCLEGLPKELVHLIVSYIRVFGKKTLVPVWSLIKLCMLFVFVSALWKYIMI
jgi:hypothetical protein